MQATVKPLTPVQQADGKVLGQFEFAREGKATLRFSLTFDPNATQQDISRAVAAKCLDVVAHEPSPALAMLTQMADAGATWNMPDAPAQ